MLFKKTNIMIFLILILFLLVIFIVYNKNTNNITNPNNPNNPNNTTNPNNPNNPNNINNPVYDNFDVKTNNIKTNQKNSNNVRFKTDNQIIDNKVKLVNKKDSLLQKTIRDDLEKNVKGVLVTLEQINNDKKKIVRRDDGYSADSDKKYKGYTGYNSYVNLRTYSHAPITSIGKQLITAFDDFPVAS